MPGRNRVSPLFSSPSVSSTRGHFLSRSLQGPHLSSNPGHRFGKEASMPPDPEAADSRREPKFPYLDRSFFPILKKRESQRHPSSLSDSDNDNVNFDDEIVAGDGGRSMTAGLPSVAGPEPEPEPEPEGGGLEEFRAKLLVHLREAADRLNLIVPPPIRTHPISGPLTLPVGPVSSSSAAEDAGHRSLGRRRPPGAPIPTDRHLSPSPPSEMRNRPTAVIVRGVHQEPQPDSATAPSSEPLSSAADAVGLWNLRRRRRGPSRAPIPVERHVSLSPVAVRSSTRARREMERPLFSITLTREEIAEDIYAVTGSLPRRRPTKRPRAVQRQLDSLLPGSWLSEVTADTYKVRNY